MPTKKEPSGDNANNNAKEVGRRGEATAEAHLLSLGYHFLARNYRCRAGEIDLIFLDGETVVFVEVKARSGYGFGMPQEAVDRRKRRKIILSAGWFLAERGWDDRLVRFDVVAVTPDPLDRTRPGGRVEHIADAFGT